MLRFIFPCSLVGSSLLLISIHPMLRFIEYRQRAPQEKHAFQYIPCYGLSEVILVAQFDRMLFQYIPCYGLSNRMSQAEFKKMNFNTSHVTVYPSVKEFGSVDKSNFNTSHVTVYLMILSHFYLGIFHHFLYFTSFQHFLPADYKI